MEYKTAFVDSTLKIRITCILTGADPRPCPYGDGQYLPDKVQFTLVSHGEGHGNWPSAASRFTAEDITLSGFRLKKDGTPGTLRKDEEFYSYSRRRPQWLTDIITAHTEGLI